MENKLIIVPSPHVKDKATTSSIMLDVLLALMPALLASVILFGPRSLLLCAVCVASCVLFEYLFRLVTKKSNTISDFSAAVTGLLLAFNLPVTFPLWKAVIGCFVAIVIVKQMFGGIGQNFANPAIVGRIVLFISFAKDMSNFMVPSFGEKGLALVAGATPLGIVSNQLADPLPSYLDLFLGIRGGVLGETCVLALLLGGIYLIVKKVISPVIPLTYLGTVFVLTFLLGADPVFHILTGGLMLGAFFMATDYVTSPITNKGKFIFGLGCGLITVLIRLYAAYPEGVSFAILLMNILTPHIDSLTRQKPFGGVK